MVQGWVRSKRSLINSLPEGSEINLEFSLSVPISTLEETGFKTRAQHVRRRFPHALFILNLPYEYPALGREAYNYIRTFYNKLLITPLASHFTTLKVVLNESF